MTRRSFLSTASLSTASLGPTGAALAAQTKRPPNVLMILADDLGHECLNCYGGTSYKTPNLDRFAASSVRFTHAFAQPLCTPTRVQLMTGQHNFRNWVGFGLIDPHEKTFGHMMQQAGYRTAIAGKWQFYSYEAKGSPRWRKGMVPENGGFHEYLLWHDRDTEDKGSRYADPVINQNGKLVPNTKGKYGPDMFRSFLGDFIKRNREQPFFAYYSMALTHAPFNLTPKSKDWPTGDRLKDDPKNYADMVEYMDYDFGQLMKLLEEAGVADNTLIMYFADNGTPKEITSRKGAQVIPGGKGLTTDGGMHVPMIARMGKPLATGRVCHDLVDSTDFLPTMMEATGAKWIPGKPVDGRSFLPQLRGEKGNPREALFAHYDPHPGCKNPFTPTRLAWDHTHKLYLDGRLYDLEKDPFEKKPIEAAGPRKKLQGVLDAMAKVKAPKFNKWETDGRPAY